MVCATNKFDRWQLRRGICWGIVFFALCCGCEGKKAPEPRPVGGAGPAVVVSEVRQQTVPVYQEFVARTEAKETVEVRARVEGILEKQLFKEGVMVKKGQPLYLIVRRPFEAKLQSAKAQVAIARARLNQADAQLNKCQKDVLRLRPLAAEQAVPQQDLEAAVAQENIAAASIEEAKAAIDAGVASAVQAQLNLEYCSIASPIGGLIGRIQANLRAVESRERQAVLRYQQTILGAFQEVSDSLAAVRGLHDARVQREQLNRSLEDQTRLANLRYRGGVTSYLEVLDAERQFFEAELSLARERRNELLSVITLYKALGGGGRL